MTTTLLMTTFRRPDYTQQVLDSIRANSAHSDLSNYTLRFACEPGYPDVVRVCQAVDFMKKTVVVNPRVMGVCNNPFLSLKSAFSAGADAVLYCEDDVLISSDTIRLFEFCLTLPNIDEYLCLNLFNPDSKTDSPPDLVIRKKDTSALGIGMTRGQWKRWYEPNWHKDKRGWDWSISGLLASTPELYALQPALSRSSHIGREKGVHYVPKIHDSQYLNKPWYQGTEKFEFRMEQVW